MEVGEAVKYDVRTCGFDVVEPTTAKTVAVWRSGEPAIVTNAYGKGHVIFLTATYPGLSHTKRGFRYKFWPGTRELLASAVRGALEAAEGTLPFEVNNCPSTVEVVMRRQTDKSRYILHLLNYDDKSPPVRGVEVTVRRPAGESVTAFYPTDGARIEPKYGPGTVNFTVRDFEVHEAAVVQY